LPLYDPAPGPRCAAGARAGHELARGRARGHPVGSRRGSRLMRVLIADDSRVMRQIVIRTLRQAGYGDWEVTQAENGAQLVELAQAEQFDLVLSDWNMPVMTGIDALRTLRAAGSTVPFGFVTSEGSEPMRRL